MPQATGVLYDAHVYIAWCAKYYLVYCCEFVVQHLQLVFFIAYIAASLFLGNLQRMMLIIHIL